MVDPVKVENVLEQVQSLLALQNVEGSAQVLRELHPADSAEVLMRLEAEDQARLIELLENETLADIFEQMDEEEMAEVAQFMESDAVVAMLDEMAPDMAADLLGELDEVQATAYLDRMEDSAQVEQLLTYEEDTAGGIMNPLKPMLRRHMTAAEAIAFLRENYEDEHELQYLYVLDRHGHLIGVVSLRAMILARPEQTLEELMNPQVITVKVDDDQEEAARLLARYDLLALPVVDGENRMLGILTVDDLMDITEEEVTEDFHRIGGMAPVEIDYSRAGPVFLWRKRIGWLLILLLADFLSSSVIAYFEEALTAAVALAFFIPMLIDSGGNTGTQSATLVIRGLATGQLEIRDWLRVLWKELRVGLLLGVAMGGIVYLRGFFWRGGPEIGLVVGLTMVVLVLWANLIGSLLPIILTKLKLDPAVVSSPFITTAVDVTGLFVYFTIARWVLGI